MSDSEGYAETVEHLEQEADVWLDSAIKRLDWDERATIECTCGETFRKEKTAKQHLGDVAQ